VGGSGTVWLCGGGLPAQTAALAGVSLSADSYTIGEAAVYWYLSLLTSLKNSSRLLKGEDTRKSLKRDKILVNRSWGQSQKVKAKVNKLIFYGKATYDELQRSAQLQARHICSYLRKTEVPKHFHYGHKC